MDEMKEEEVDMASSGNEGGASGGGAVGLGGGAGGMHYTIPGILHFLQHEWSKFEMERSQWEVEKSELQARIAFLNGERKGQENLKNDLVRRIKMLEYALKQERAKYNKLKYGPDSNAADASKPSAEEDGLEFPPMDGDNIIAVSNVNWRKGRQLLRQYLQEIGYTDHIIDVRSNRVRSLLGLGDLNDVNEENRTNLAMNGDNNTSTTARRPDGSNATAPGNKNRAPTLAEEMLIDTEAAVMANFDFLTSEAEVDDDDDLEDNEDGGNCHDMKSMAGKLAQAITDPDDKDTEEVLNEFNFLSNTDNVDGMKKEEAAAARVLKESEVLSDWGVSSDEIKRLQELYQASSAKKRQAGSRALSGSNVVDYLSLSGSSKPNQSSSSLDKKGELGGNLELGELEQLTIANENETSYDITAPKESFRKTWSAKYTLRSHFDSVRALAFHPTEPVLITASEDQTLKLWNLQKTVQTKKSSSLDVEPVYTFRAHQGAVLCLAVAPTGDFIFSGGMDTTIRCWVMPSPNVDPYDPFEPSVLANTLNGHADAVWGVSYHGQKQQLLSCSADGTVKLWKPSNPTQPLLRTFGGGESRVPTSIDWILVDPNHMVAAYDNSACIIYDIETGKPVIKLDTESAESTGAITKVVSHPTLPLTITAHEDSQIRFFDNATGKLTHAMVAHLDAVTSLSVDTNGLYLISGSHDCSVRLWNLETKTCVQEITAHRKKFDESIFDVAFHPSKPFIASAGADALAKVFV